MTQKEAWKLAQPSTEILRVTPEGEFIWHENADRLIDEGDFTNSPSTQHILRALRKPLTQPEQEPVAITAQMAFAFHEAITDGALGTDDMMDIMRGLEAAFAHITTPPQRKPLTHEQRFDLLTKFEPYKNKWEAPAILIDMVEAAHGIRSKT